MIYTSIKTLEIRNIILLFFVFQGFLFPSCSNPEESKNYITRNSEKDAFPLANKQQVPALYISGTDYPGVVRIAEMLKTDLESVTGKSNKMIIDKIPDSEYAIIIGTEDKSELLDKLTESGKLDLSEIEGKWETFLIQTIQDPFPGVAQALVIAGSDKRGTIYGMLDLSEKLGVSPWHWWADVPVKRKDELYVLPGTWSNGEPKIQYRGIFINDEAPALSGWVHENYGSFNHEFYEHVFELILRLKGNFLWPAMWGRAFYDDDSLNAVLADEYGIVIGTSHHEPLMRAHVEWSRYGEGPWNYEKNPEKLREFWREGVVRMGDNESIVTIGMRGDGDEPMTEGTAISLLEKIVRDQREIITDVTGKPASETPQSWALYKEVLDYYDKGMKVPEDIMLLLCDDNWGNIRRLPEPEDRHREGGFGIYYHFDYVGDPRNYKWLNTNQVERTWEQMHLAYEYGARKLWLVNVGDIKPMEFPINFFLDYAWNPEKFPAERLPDYYTDWSEKQFGEEYAVDIGEIIALYTKYNSRRKPELLSPQTYSLHHYNEAERILQEYKELEQKSLEIAGALPGEYRDAYFELVDYPVQACANLNELYITSAKNRMYARQKRVKTNELAKKARDLFARDSTITAYYHNDIAGGKWNHIASQTHIGYVFWQEPPRNFMPEVFEIEPVEDGEMGISIECSDSFWPEDSDSLVLPQFDPVNNPSYYFELFNRGKTAYGYSVDPGEEWITPSKETGEVVDQVRIRISIDWSEAPEGIYKIPLIITTSKNEKAEIIIPVYNPERISVPGEVSGFIENNGVVSIQAEHFTVAQPGLDINWQVIPNLGRTGASVTTFPVTAKSQMPGQGTPYLEYDIYLFEPGEINVKAYLCPTLNFTNGPGFRYAVSIDDEEPAIVNMHADGTHFNWQQWVSNNVNICESKHIVETPGRHSLKFWRVDPAVVLQKIVLERKPAKTSYLGPPESLVK